MELSISDDKTKELLTEVMIELLRTKRDLIRDILMEALEEVGLANAKRSSRAKVAREIADKGYNSVKET
jgi:hypothetical protein